MIEHLEEALMWLVAADGCSLAGAGLPQSVMDEIARLRAHAAVVQMAVRGAPFFVATPPDAEGGG